MRRKRLYGDNYAKMPEGWPHNEVKRRMKTDINSVENTDEEQYEYKSISSQEVSDSDSCLDVSEFNELSELPIEPKRSLMPYHEEQRLLAKMADYNIVIPLTEQKAPPSERHTVAHNLPHFSR